MPKPLDSKALVAVLWLCYVRRRLDPFHLGLEVDDMLWPTGPNQLNKTQKT